MNRRLDPKVETVFMMPAEELFVTSRRGWSRKCSGSAAGSATSCRGWWRSGCARSTGSAGDVHPGKASEDSGQ